MSRTLFNIMRVLGTIGIVMTTSRVVPAVWDTCPMDAVVIASALFALVLFWWSAP